MGGFKCNRCGCTKVEHVVEGLREYREIIGINKDTESLTYGEIKVDDTHCSTYQQCAECMLEVRADALIIAFCGND